MARRYLVVLAAFLVVCPVMADVLVTTAELDELAEIFQAYEKYTQTLSESLTKVSGNLESARTLLSASNERITDLELSFNAYVTATKAEARRLEVCQWVERGLFAAAIVAIIIFK